MAENKENRVASPDNPTAKIKSSERSIIKKKRKLGKLSLITMGGLGVHEFIKSSKEDKGLVKSATNSAGIMTAAYMVNPLVLAGGMAAKEIAEVSYGVGKHAYKKSQEYNQLSSNSPFASNSFIETRETFTMRQAGMAAINQARGNLENSMMGNEAGFLHR